MRQSSGRFSAALVQHLASPGGFSSGQQCIVPERLTMRSGGDRAVPNIRLLAGHTWQLHVDRHAARPHKCPEQCMHAQTTQSRAEPPPCSMLANSLALAEHAVRALQEFPAYACRHWQGTSDLRFVTARVFIDRLTFKLRAHQR